MTALAHRIYIGSMIVVVLGVIIYLSLSGMSYYRTEIVERFFHKDHNLLNPGGLHGHSLGIVGTLLILLGVFGYMWRKRSRKYANLGMIKHWLEFHIFLCTLGPVLILYHTAFKFGGLVSISFWSMLAVVLSGVIGRFIYIQIPRNIKGNEMSLQEAQKLRHALIHELNATLGMGISVFEEYLDTSFIRKKLEESGIRGEQKKKILSTIRKERKLSRRIRNLGKMQNLFRYWHVAHLPFAIVMLVIMTIHVGVVLLFG